MEKNLETIEGDGFLFHLLHFMWLKDPMMGVVPSLNVPDTILFQNDLPYIWYFVKDRCLKRKSNIKLTVEEIEKKFLRKVPKSGIAAVYINQYTQNSTENVVFEYLTVPQFKAFLYEKSLNQKQGILQRFIQPKAEHNFIIRVIWGANLCLFEKIENLNNINDKKQDPYQRVLTFEGFHVPSRTVPLRGYVLPHHLENIMFNIVKHISNVTYDNIQISRIIGNFKIDENDKIWFLFCSSLRIKERDDSMLRKYIYSEKLSETIYETKIPKIIEKFKLSNFKQANLEKNFKCLHCGKKVNFSEIYKLKYKDVIRGWNLDHFSVPSMNDKSLNNSNFNNFRNQEDDDGEAEHIYYTKTNRLKKNICQVYRNIFNENIREEIYSGLSNKISPNSSNDYEETDSIKPDYNLINIKKNYNIPIIISRLHPNLKEKEYFALSKNPGFLNKNALVCETCYLEIIAHSHANQNLKQVIVKHKRDKEIIGTGKLDPQSIAYRYKETREKILFRNKESTSFQSESKSFRSRKRSEPLLFSGEEKKENIDIYFKESHPTDEKPKYFIPNMINNKNFQDETEQKINNFFKINKKNFAVKKIVLKSQERSTDNFNQFRERNELFKENFRNFPTKRPLKSQELSTENSKNAVSDKNEFSKENFSSITIKQLPKSKFLNLMVKSHHKPQINN